MIKEMQLKKHVRVRKQITEGKKIRDIEAALLGNEKMKNVPSNTEEFETLTSKEMNDILNQE